MLSSTEFTFTTLSEKEDTIAIHYNGSPFTETIYQNIVNELIAKGFSSIGYKGLSYSRVLKEGNNILNLHIKERIIDAHTPWEGALYISDSLACAEGYARDYSNALRLETPGIVIELFATSAFKENIYFLNPINECLDQPTAEYKQIAILTALANTHITNAGIAGRADTNNADASVETILSGLLRDLIVLPLPHEIRQRDLVNEQDFSAAEKSQKFYDKYITITTNQVNFDVWLDNIAKKPTSPIGFLHNTFQVTGITPAISFSSNSASSHPIGVTGPSYPASYINNSGTTSLSSSVGYSQSDSSGSSIIIGNKPTNYQSTHTSSVKDDSISDNYR